MFIYVFNIVFHKICIEYSIYWKNAVDTISIHKQHLIKQKCVGSSSTLFIYFGHFIHARSVLGEVGGGYYHRYNGIIYDLTLRHAGFCKSDSVHTES